MVKSTTVYKGKKHCELTHEPSGSKIETDAPKDNNGLGESFSPTDLVGAALASCAVTTMAIVAERDGITFENARVEVTKVMTDTPRKIASLALVFSLPASLSEKERSKLEHIALTCPVHRSLHPDVKIPMTFNYV